MPFEISPGFKIAETVNERFARLIREGAAKYPEVYVYESGEKCCAITAAARVLGYPMGYRGPEPLLNLLSEHGIPKDLARSVSMWHYRESKEAGDGTDYRVIVADMLERGEINA